MALLSCVEQVSTNKSGHINVPAHQSSVNGDVEWGLNLCVEQLIGRWVGQLW